MALSIDDEEERLLLEIEASEAENETEDHNYPRLHTADEFSHHRMTEELNVRGHESSGFIDEDRIKLNKIFCGSRQSLHHRYYGQKNYF